MDDAKKTVATPEYSEHQTRLALDLYLIVNGKNIDENKEMVQYRGVPHCSKTGESCHEPNDLAGYDGFAVAVYDKTGESYHEEMDMAGFSDSVVVANDTTG